MTEATTVEAASLRLQRALEALEEAVERQIELGRGRAALSEQIHSLGADRARLASELDLEIARAQRLQTVTRDVSARLDEAIATVRTVLADDPE
jgi:hypothetical protein